MATSNKNLSTYDKDAFPEASSLKIGIVVSDWNPGITSKLYEGALATLVDCGVWENHIYTMDVPGSFELIMGSKRMIQKHQPDAVIAIGSIIQGETRHFEFVCQGVAQGIARINAEGNTPVIFCVLTDDTLGQAEARSGGAHGNKGIESAVAAIKMASL